MIEIDSAFTKPRTLSGEIIKKEIVCDEILSLEDVCNWLGVSERTVIRYVEEYDFPCRKMGTTRLFGRKAIIDWVNNPK